MRRNWGFEQHRRSTLAITDQNTALVIGAGVSAPFGFPLGASCITKICNQIGDEIKRLYADNDLMGNRLRQSLLNSAKTTNGFRRFPIHGAIARQFLIEDGPNFQGSELNNELKKIRSLAGLLENQTSETIDDFIVENPSYSHLAKIAIAAIFMLNAYAYRDGKLKCLEFESREFSPDPNAAAERNWIHLLINIVRQGIRAGTVTEQNPIIIISFNYDGIVERVLEKQFANTEAGYGHFSDFIKIHHVHGYCGDLEDFCNDPAVTCSNWASNISVVNDQSTPEHLETTRREARTVIEAASEIYACGFSFAGPNCRLLNLTKPKNKLAQRLISFCNYDGNVGLSKAVSRFGESPMQFAKPPTRIEEASGSFDRKMSVSDWFKLGYVGELPG